MSNQTNDPAYNNWLAQQSAQQQQFQQDFNNGQTGNASGQQPVSSRWAPYTGPISDGAPGSGQTPESFGSTQGNITQGGLIGGTTPQQTAAMLNSAMSRQAPTIAGVNMAGITGTQASQQGLMGKLQGYAQGLGPSAAQIGTTLGMGSAANAGAAGIHGGNALAMRGGIGAQQTALGGAGLQGANARAAEQSGAMGGYGSAAQGLTGQSLSAQGLANQQIQQQQQLGLTQNTANYTLGQGQLNTGLQTQEDYLAYANKMQGIQQQLNQNATGSALTYGGAGLAAV